ncbi:MAG: hypothetical protein FWG90_11450 [Oscillospiraceae bacterium]|nr:hypothetical protein [Oscillospiraceae bacterium]
MAYETKVLMMAIGDIISSSKTTEEAYKRVAKIANAEGVILEPFKIKEKKKTEKEG